MTEFGLSAWPVVSLAVSLAIAATLVFGAVLIAARRDNPFWKHAVLSGGVWLAALLPVLLPAAYVAGFGWNIASLPGAPSQPAGLGDIDRGYAIVAEVRDSGSKPLRPANEVPQAERADVTRSLNQGYATARRAAADVTRSATRDVAHAPLVNTTAAATGSDSSIISVPIEPSWSRAAASRYAFAFAWSVAGMALVVWIAGSLMTALRTGLAYRRLRRLIGTCRPVSDKRATVLLAESAALMRLRRAPRLVAGDAVPTPFACGLLRPMLVLPASVIAGDAAALRFVLMHELAHIARRDLWTGVVQHIAACEYWWHPWARRVNTELNEVREHLCDVEVLAQGGPAEQYAATLIELAGRAAAMPAGSLALLTAGPSSLSRRIDTLLQKDRPMPKRMSFVSRSLLAVGLFAAGVVCTLLLVREGDGTLSPWMETLVQLEERDKPVELPRVANTIHFADAPAPVMETAAVSGGSGSTMASMGIDFGTAPPMVDVPMVLAGEPSTPMGGSILLGGPVPAEPSVDPASPFASSEAPRAGDAFASPVGPAPMAPFLDVATVPAAPPPRQVVLLELGADPDGKLAGIKYFTEDLGTGDDGLGKLTEKFETPDALPEGLQLEVQIAVDPNLSFAGLSRVLDIVKPHTEHISFTHTITPTTEVLIDSVQTQEVRILYIRDAAGAAIADDPVLLVGRSVVGLDALPAALNAAPAPEGEQSQGTPHKRTLFIHADAETPTTVIQAVIERGQLAGFQQFTMIAAESNVTPNTGAEAPEALDALPAQP